MSLLERIGYSEWIALPEWGIHLVRAKADTGAMTSALDVVRIEVSGNDIVHFLIARHRYRRHRVKQVTTKISRRSHIKSSTGESKERLCVMTDVLIGSQVYPVEFSLVNRTGMINRVLLGRRFLSHRYLVDSSTRFVLGKPNVQGGVS